MDTKTEERIIKEKLDACLSLSYLMASRIFFSDEEKIISEYENS